MSRPYIPKRFLGAFKAGHRASSREFIDEELSYKLLKRILHSNYSDLEAMEALDYLTKFNNEYHKAVLKKGDRDAFHNTKELYQERSTANNARNRDIMSILRHKIESLTPPTTDSHSEFPIESTIALESFEMGYHEEVIVGLLDAKNKKAR